MFFTLKKEKLTAWYKNYTLKDWRFWYKTLFVVLMTFIVLFSYIQLFVNMSSVVKQINDLNLSSDIASDKLKEVLDNLNLSKSIQERLIFYKTSDGLLHAGYQPFEQFIQMSSFFTLISNLLILIWMYVALFKPLNEGKKGILNKRTSIIFAAYITVTFLLYNLILRITVSEIANNFMSHFVNEMFHTVAPIFFIGYVLFGVKWEKGTAFNFKELSTTWVFGILGLCSYGAYAIIRGLLKVAGGTPGSSQQAFPYPFLQVTELNVKMGAIELPGIVLFLIFMIVIASICIGFTSLYNFIIIKNVNKGAKKGVNNEK
ncbi:unknown transmembrane protein [Mesoplasma florum W37]|uniref:Transmembrane protein n=1 Tax=Mesoplasma florum TaxID=2151 RepID=A0AAD0HS52_MESFO|nr:Pr6Pr family membrane protein [Mesoplasma florum]AGY41604.1 unknown transmembrane protein [Mesoplasma florum W37]AVN59815.1 hypothetical protein CG008_02870 [Mesoplasma florum]AVN65942.1 putative transmembrane protein [Mesoplasma florum]